MTQIKLHNTMTKDREVLDQGVPGEVIRFVMLSTHYRKPMDWTEKKREEAEETLSAWGNLIEDSPVEDAAPDNQLVAALAADLNTHGAITRLHELAKAGEVSCLKASLDLLGVETIPTLATEIPAELSRTVEKVLLDWRIARASRDWDQADRLRDDLADAGVIASTIGYSTDGKKWDTSPNFDPAKLEALRG